MLDKIEPENTQELTDLTNLPGIDLGKIIERCLSCNSYILDSVLYKRLRVCPNCRFHHSISAIRYIAAICDQGTFEELYPTVRTQLEPDALPEEGYSELLARERERTGVTEAVVTGQCQIKGMDTILISLNFSFQSGTIGVVAGEKIALAFDYAARKKLPCVAVITSIEDRSQEGLLSMLQMVKTVTATRKMALKRVPFISVLGNPCIGQAFASFVSQADVILAEPQARVGFMAPKVVTDGRTSDSGSAYRAEDSVEWGQIDHVVDREELSNELGKLVQLLANRGDFDTAKLESKLSHGRAKRGSMSNARFYLDNILTDFFPLQRHNYTGQDRTVVCGVARLINKPVAIIAIDKIDAMPAVIKPVGLYRAIQLIGLANKFRIPILTFIDSAEPEVGLDSEHHGIGRAISEALGALVQSEVPIISSIIGAVSGEMALALGTGDHTIMLGNSALIMSTPYDGALELLDSADKIPHVSPLECIDYNIAHRVIEVGKSKSAKAAYETAQQLRDAMASALVDLSAKRQTTLTRDRVRRLRELGSGKTEVEGVLRARWTDWQAGITAAVSSIGRGSKRTSTRR